jgi:hypothetical protein
VALAIIGFCHGMHAGTRPAWASHHRYSEAWGRDIVSRLATS